MYCKKCGAVIDENSTFCAACGEPLETGNIGAGMKWHKVFIVLFSFSALANVATGLEYFAGLQYNEYDSVSKNREFKDYLYAKFYGLHALDIAFDIACIVLALFQIFIIVRLAKLKRKAPFCLRMFYAHIVCIELVYALTIAGLTGTSLDMGFLSKNLLVHLIVAVINLIYYGQRKHLFVNP